MSKDEPYKFSEIIEDLFEQIYDLQDFLIYNGIEEKEFVQWQKDRDNITYH